MQDLFGFSSDIIDKVKIFWNPHFKWLNEISRKILLFGKIEQFIANSDIVACNG